MKKIKSTVALILFLSFSLSTTMVPYVLGAEDSWTSKAPMQIARSGLGVTAVNGKIYAIGGDARSGKWPYVGSFVGTNEEYDPETDTWAFNASMPTPRCDFAIAAYQNKIYCIGGAIGFTVDEWGLFHSYVASGVNEVYDTVTNTWETKTPIPVVEMKIQAHVVNGKIYVMGVAFTYVFDPENDSWNSKTRMPASPPPSSGSYPVSVVVDDKIVVSGEFSTGLSSSEQKILIYDTEADSWSEGTSGAIGVVEAAAGATMGVKAPKRVYVLGSPNQVYDPEADAWATAAAMPTGRMDFGVAVVNDILYAIGGYYTESYEAWLHGLVTPVAVNEQYIPIGYGVPPEIKVVSPVNQTYNGSNVSLVFTVNKPVNWTGYSLDGKENVTLTGNTTLAGLASGLHNVTVYARDEFENMGVSETINFTIAVPEPEPEPFPVVPVAAASVATIAVVSVGLLVYFKKRKR